MSFNPTDQAATMFVFKSSEGLIHLLYKKGIDNLYKLFIKSDKKKVEIPLLLEEYQILLTIRNICNLNLNQVFNHRLLIKIIKGAAMIGIKTDPSKICEPL